MFTFIVCKYLARQINDEAGKAVMAIIAMFGDYLLIISVVEQFV